MRERSFLFAIAAALVICGAAFSIQGQSRNDIRRSEQLVREGDRAFGQKNYREAVEKYAEAVVHVPRDANTRFKKGLAHVMLDDHSLALSELNTALDLGYSKPAEVYAVRWRLHYAAEDYALALQDVTSGLALDPDNLDLLIAQGDMHFVNQRYEAAQAAYAKALTRQPGNAELHLNLAKIYYNLGDTEKQAVSAQFAIDRQTRDLAEAYLLLGDAHQKRRDLGAAARAYQNALAADPNDYAVYQTLAEMYRAENRYDDAIAIIRRALTQLGLQSAIYTDLSWYYSLANRHEEAAEAAKAGVKLAPDNPMAYTNLCRAYNDLQRPEMAARECNNALTLKPGDGETNFYLGRSYDLQNKPAEATQYYKRAVSGLEQFVEERPDYADGFYLLGNAYFADNQRRKAVEAYNKALELSPAFTKAYYNLGMIYVLEKNKRSATSQYDRLVKLDPALAAQLKAEIDKI